MLIRECRIYTAYHNLWRIEESFRIMKSQLDARPVYLQKEDTITGHFLICYLSIVLTRILQIYVLKDKYGKEEIFDFIRDFRVAKVSDRKYINLTRSSSFIKTLASETGLPLTSDGLYGSRKSSSKVLFSALQIAVRRRIIESRSPCSIAIKRACVHPTFLRI